MQEQELLQIRTSVAKLSREMGKNISNQRMSMQYRQAKRFSSDDTDGALAVSKLAKDKKSSPRPLTRQRSFTSPADIPKFKDLVAEFKKQYSTSSAVTSSDECSDLDSARSSNTSGTAEKSPRSPQDKEFLTPSKSKKDLDKKGKDKTKKDKDKSKYYVKEKKMKDKSKDKNKDKKTKEKESKSSKTDKERKDLTNSSKSIESETHEGPTSSGSNAPDSDSISFKQSPSSLNGNQLRLSFSQQLRRHSSSNIKQDVDSPARPSLKLSASRGSLLADRIESPKPKDSAKKDKKKDKERQEKDKGVSFGAIATIRDAGDDTKVVCLVGGRVGKTALLERILSDTSSSAISPSKQRKSIIVDVDTPQGPKKMEMQDTSSADAHSDVYCYYKWYSEPEYFVFVYSFDDKESLREIPKHVNAVRTVKQTKSVPLILVGNKCDVENKEVKVAEAEAMAYSLRCAHVTVSAKTGENISKLMEQIKYLTKLAVNENDLFDSVDSESSSLELHFKSPRSRLLTRNSKKRLVEVPVSRECKEFVPPTKSPENIEINYVNAKKKYVFTSHFSCIRVWEIETGKLLATIEQIKPTGQLEVKSHLLYFINGNEIVTWDIKKLAIAHRFTIEDNIQITRFIVHDFGLFCGDMEGNCWAWTTDGSALKLEGHSAAISSIVVIEEMVIAGAANGALLGWQLTPEISASNRLSFPSPKSLNSSVTPPHSPSPNFSSLSASTTFSSPPNSPWAPSPLANYDANRAFTVISSSRTFSGHTGFIMGLTQYNHALYSSSTDESVRAWDITTGECLEEYHRKSITAMPEYFRLGFNNMSDNGIVFVISENDPSLVAFKLKSGAVVSAYQGHRGRITSLQFTSHHLFSGSEDSSIRVWDIKDAECLVELRGHKGRVGSLSLRQERDKTMLLSGGEDGVLRLWDLTTLLQKKKD